MATSRISLNLPPHIDPTKAPLAFGRRAIPKLNEELQDKKLITRQRALMSLCDLVHDPNEAYYALEIGCVSNLKNLLNDENQTVRHKSVEVLYIMAQHSVCRQKFIKDDVISAIAFLFDDEVDIVRKFSHQAIGMITHVLNGAQAVIEANLIPAFVHKLNIELDEIKVFIFDSLHYCSRINPIQALDCGAITILADLLDHKDDEIKSKAARCLMDVCVPLQGKQEAVKHTYLVPTTVKLLEDKCEEVHTAAAGIIMTVAITTEGKYAFLNAGALSSLEKMSKSKCSEARLYSTKALTCLAEAPIGRKALLRYIEEKKEDTDKVHVSLQRADAIAKKVITWEP